MRRSNAGATAAKFITFMMTLIFGLVSVLMFFVVPQAIEKGSASCTEPVSAVIIDIVESSDGSTYAPVYSYDFEGETYNVRSNLYTNVIPQEGAIVDIKIDPNEPIHMVDPARVQFTNHVMSIIGIVFGVIAASLLIVFIILCIVLK